LLLLSRTIIQERMKGWTVGNQTFPQGRPIGFAGGWADQRVSAARLYRKPGAPFSRKIVVFQSTIIKGRHTENTCFSYTELGHTGDRLVPALISPFRSLIFRAGPKA
jgi:hypothetical protein